jgi:hypothetical protein
MGGWRRGGSRTWRSNARGTRVARGRWVHHATTRPRDLPKESIRVFLRSVQGKQKQPVPTDVEMQRAEVRQANRCLSAAGASLQLPCVQVATVAISASFLIEEHRASMPLATR